MLQLIYTSLFAGMQQLEYKHIKPLKNTTTGILKKIRNIKHKNGNI